MKFVDEVRIYVKAGDGGKGAVAFRREKFIEKGGPCGGDGGNGGSVYFTADPQLTTLLDFRYQQHHRAPSGENGMGADCNGHGGKDLELRVPVGTLIRDEDTGELLFDLSEAGQRVQVAKGGRGGLGNMNFATSTRQTPRFAQDGTPGEEITLRLELRLLADVGLLGFPNAGKSTLISVVSRARPKIADYPFTTLNPQLGVVRLNATEEFVLADIPGLIEGAAEGAGLGTRFLGHVERCAVLLHLIDGSQADPVRAYETVRAELEEYGGGLADKPEILALTKTDAMTPQARASRVKALERATGRPVRLISGATGEGVPETLRLLADTIYRAREEATEA